MRIASIFQAGGPVVGMQLGEQWIDFSAALQTYQLVTTRVQEPLITTTYELLQRGLFTASSFQEVADFVDRHALADAFQIKDPVKLLAPLCPGNFVGIGHQYPPKPRPRTQACSQSYLLRSLDRRTKSALSRAPWSTCRRSNWRS